MAGEGETTPSSSKDETFCDWQKSILDSDFKLGLGNRGLMEKPGSPALQIFFSLQIFCWTFFNSDLVELGVKNAAVKGCREFV